MSQSDTNIGSRFFVRSMNNAPSGAGTIEGFERACALFRHSAAAAPGIAEIGDTSVSE